MLEIHRFDRMEAAAARRGPKRRSLLALTGLLATGLLAAGVSSAQAVGGSCSAWTENVPLPVVDGSRAVASCSYLQGDSKAQGYLDLTLAPDKYTAWFTALNKQYRSDYDRGPNRGAGYNIAHV